MCKAFSCLIHRDGKVYWKAGIDSHSNLVEHFRLKDDKKELDADFVKVELTPERGYLHPEGRWTPKIDQGQTPHWWKDSMLMRADKALEEWKQEVYSKIDLEGARNPVKPWEIEPPKVGPEQLALLKEWASVRVSVWPSVWASVGVSVRVSVGASVGASVGDSVYAYAGSLFPNISDWKYTEKVEGIPKGEYPFRSAVALWKQGLIPVKTSKGWALYHPVRGKNAVKMWEGKP